MMQWQADRGKSLGKENDWIIFSWMRTDKVLELSKGVSVACNHSVCRTIGLSS